MNYLSKQVLPKGVIVALALTTAMCWAAPPLKSMSTAQLKDVVDSHFDSKQGFQKDDLISQADAREILTALDRLGWKVSDGEEILEQLLPANHIMTKTFASPQGAAFMRKVDGYKLIYDRLHRTAELPGGKALVRDIVKLPNGEIYAKMKPVRGNPNFTDLLPKGRNGKTPPPRDFGKPTGYIYTVNQLLTRLEQSRQRDFATTTPMS